MPKDNGKHGHRASIRAARRLKQAERGVWQPKGAERHAARVVAKQRKGENPK